MPYSAVTQPWPRAAQERRNPVLDARRAQHAGGAEADQHRALGVRGIAAHELQRPQLPGCAAARPHAHAARQRSAAALVLSLYGAEAATACVPRSMSASRSGLPALCANFDEILVIEVGPKPVGAQEQHVAGFQAPAGRDAHFGKRGVAAQAALDVVAHGVSVHFRLGDQALAQQHLDMTVIARALEHLRLAQLIDAAVADVRPVGRRVLHQADGAGRPRPRLDRQTRAQLDHFFVRAAERQMQKAQRIEDRVRRLPERLEQRRERSLGRAGALGVPAHAVDHRQKHGVLPAATATRS